MIPKLFELLQPLVSVSDPASEGDVRSDHSLKEVLGSIMGESSMVQNAKLEEVSRSAIDLTNLIKRNKSTCKSVDAGSTKVISTKSNEKRKIEFDDEIVNVSIGKKAKIPDTIEN